MAKKKRSSRTIKSLETQIKRETARQEEQAKEMMNNVDDDIKDIKTSSMNTELAGKIRKNFMNVAYKCNIDKFTEKLLEKYPTLNEGPIKSALQNSTYKDHSGQYDIWLEQYYIDTEPLTKTGTIILPPDLLLYKLQQWKTNPFHYTSSKDYTKYLHTRYWLSFASWFKSDYQKECQECGSKINLCVHHKNYLKTFGTEWHDLNWCICLCKGCHKRTHDKWTNKVGKHQRWKQDSMENYVKPYDPDVKILENL
ncbi:MAG: hypothetical protein ACTSQA_05220 [Candidatus Heimdallarchaeaceae archaeon]